MRIPLSWLNDYIAVADDEITAAADALTMAGLEVEETLETPHGPVWYTKITPNRGDWASVYGTARELAAIYPNKALLPLRGEERAIAGGGHGFSRGGGEHGTEAASAAGVSIRIDDSANCHRFRATVIEGVTIGPTPAWIQERLTAALGDRYRMINNVADITNYVMLELGQPLHAFDLDTIPNGEIVVRQAFPGEKLVTLDGDEHTLPAGTLCICDRERAISIAGIMGGRDTEITAGTTRVLLETAHFDPFSVRRTAKKTVRSEASYRFERYVDPNLVAIAAERAAQLIVAHCGGRIVGVAEAIAQPIPKRRFIVRLDRVRKLLGADVDRDAAIAALVRLGIEVEQSAGALDCVIPAWRPDLTIEDDIAEEIGRIALGYANLPERVAWQIGQRGQDAPRSAFIVRLKRLLVAEGLQEVVSHSLVGPGPLTERTASTLVLRNPMRPEASQLRTSLIPNLVGIAGRAQREGTRDLALFEVGPIYEERGGAVVEPLRVTGLVAGSGVPQAWALKGDTFPADFYFAKGSVEGLLAALSLAATFRALAPEDAGLYHPYRVAEVWLGGDRLGTVGELAGNVIAENDLPKRTCLFDLDGDLLERLAQPVTAHFTAIPEFPAVVRDLAPVFWWNNPNQTTYPYTEIERVARVSAGPYLESLRLVDVYEGANLGPGKRSLTLRFTFRSTERTLTGAEVEAAMEAVRLALMPYVAELRA